MKCEKIIEKLIEKGGLIVESSTEINDNVSTHKVIMTLKNKYFKIAYVNTQFKQFNIVKLYKEDINSDWEEWNEKELIE